MNPLTRFLRFNLVGLLGILVQLTTLALLNRALSHHYLLTSTIAVELTLLHNFLWHLHYTWPETLRPNALTALLRFHLSNGLISLLGNLALMHLFVHSLHAPILLANAIAIACCGIANFLLAHHWAFANIREPHHTPRFTIRRSLTALALLFSSTTLISQTTPTSPATLPHAPSPQTYQPPPSVSYLFNAGILCGTGASTSPVATKPTFGCGVGFTLLPLPLFFEAGIFAPQANRSNGSAYISFDGNIPLARPTSTYLPIAFVGYSRLFETGHALNYGLALALPRPGKRTGTTDSMRLELRDDYTFANPAQHNITFRVGLMHAVSD